MFILDTKDLKVKVFDINGFFMHAFGTKGQGTGEFQRPIDIFIKDKTLSVFDFANKRISNYSFDGRHLEDISLYKFGGFFRPEAVDETAIYGNLLEWDSDGGEWLKLVKYDKRTELISSISQIKNEIMYPNVNPIADKFILRIRKDGVIVWVHQKNYMIFLMTADGKIIKQVAKEHGRVKISNQDKENLINRIYGGKGNIPPNVNLVWPDFYSPIVSLIVDDNDWVYIRTSEKNSQGQIKYDIFDEKGNFRGSFFHEHSIELIKNNMAYAIAEDNEGFPMIIRYEIKLKKTKGTGERISFLGHWISGVFDDYR